MRKLKVLSICDGISCGYMALEKSGIEFEYHAVEKDKWPRLLSDNNHPGIIRWKDDVNLITKEDVEQHGPFDLIIMGPPCQGTSVSGKNDFLLDNGEPNPNSKSHTLIKCLTIYKWCQEFNPKIKVFIENVKMKKDFLQSFNELIKLTPVLLNSSLVSGQNRERYYWANFQINKPEDRGIVICDILEKGPSATETTALAWSKSTRYVMPDGKISSKKIGSVRSFIEQRLSMDKANTLNTGEGCRNQSTCNYVIQINQSKTCGGKQPYMQDRVYHSQGKSIALTAAFASRLNISEDMISFRKLSVRECARLQTIPEKFNFDSVSDAQAYKAIGNGWTVDMVAEILNPLVLEVAHV